MNHTSLDFFCFQNVSGVRAFHAANKQFHSAWRSWIKKVLIFKRQEVPQIPLVCIQRKWCFSLGSFHLAFPSLVGFLFTSWMQFVFLSFSSTKLLIGH